MQYKGGSPERNTFFYLGPLLSPQIWTTLTTFSDVEIQDLKVSLGLKMLY